MGTQTYLGISTPRCLIPGLPGPSKQDLSIPLISGFRGNRSLCLGRAWTLADARFLPNACDEGPCRSWTSPEPGPGLPPLPQSWRDPHAQFALLPQTPHPHPTGAAASFTSRIPVVSYWKNPGQPCLTPPWKDFRVPPRNAFRSNRRC